MIVNAINSSYIYFTLWKAGCQEFGLCWLLQSSGPLLWPTLVLCGSPTVIVVQPVNTGNANIFPGFSTPGGDTIGSGITWVIP
jgi:hypothetical protein